MRNVATIFLSCLTLTACFDDMGTSTDGAFEGSATSAATNGGGWGLCANTLECGPGQVCDASGICDAAWKHTYSISISQFAPTSCADEWGSADVVFELYLDGQFVQQSSAEYCPADWSAEPFTYHGWQTLQLKFFESDLWNEDMPYTDFCWKDEHGNCTSVPLSVLRAGEFDGLADDGLSALSMTATLVD